jgi:hypothetical protein
MCDFDDDLRNRGFSWDFDFAGFQSGDMIPGIHYGPTHLGGELDPIGPSLGAYQDAKKYGNRKNSSQGIYDIYGSDGFNPISHFYHHKYPDQSEFEEILTVPSSPNNGGGPQAYTLINWYTTNTGDFIGAYSESAAAAPFSSMDQDSSTEAFNHAKSKITYIPVESALPDLGSKSFTPSASRFRGTHQNNPHKACGHRFLSGIRVTGTTLDPTLGTEILPWTRSNKMILDGGLDSGALNIEAGEIYHPKLDLWDPVFGSPYTFLVTGSGIFVFPLDDSKPPQFVTGISYTSSVSVSILPHVREWFCPKNMDTVEAAEKSLVQTVYIPGAEAPPVFSYRINLLEDFEPFAGAKPWDGAELNLYNHSGEDILENTWPKSFTKIDLNPNESQYDLDAGEPISTIEFNGKFIDGPSHSTNQKCPYDSNYPAGTPFSSGILFWTTGYGGVHRACCDLDVTDAVPYLHDYNFQCILDSGYASRPEHLVGGGGSARYDEHMTPLPVLSEYNRNKSEYPSVGFSTSFDRHNIDLYMSHPNRGFVQFTFGNEDEGVPYGILREIDWGTYDGCILGGEEQGPGDAGNCAPTYSAIGHSFEQNRIVSEYEFSGMGHDFIQKIIIPWKEVWIEHTGVRRECNTDWGASNMFCMVNTFSETLQGELRHVYLVNKLWCPVVFHESVGDLEYNVLFEGVEYDPLAVANNAFWCPEYQMPFPDDDRCSQMWPVLMEWSQLDQFVGDQAALEASIGAPGGSCFPYTCVLPKHPLSLGSPPAPDGTYRDTLQNLWDEGVGDGTGYFHSNSNAFNDGSYMTAGGNWNGLSMGMLLSNSAMGSDPLISSPLPWKSGVYGSPAGGTLNKGNMGTFCLRLMPETTFRVTRTDKRYTTDVHFGEINAAPNPGYEETTLATTGFFFQTNGAGGYSEGDFISYQALLDNNMCTFNVRDAEGPNGYVGLASGSCTSASNSEIIPYWDLDNGTRNLTKLMKPKGFYKTSKDLSRSLGNQDHPFSDPVNKIGGLPAIGSLDGEGTALTTDHVEATFKFKIGMVEKWTTLLAKGEQDVALSTLRSGIS